MGSTCGHSGGRSVGTCGQYNWATASLRSAVDYPQACLQCVHSQPARPTRLAGAPQVAEFTGRWQGASGCVWRGSSSGGENRGRAKTQATLKYMKENTAADTLAQGRALAQGRGLCARRLAGCPKASRQPPHLALQGLGVHGQAHDLQSHRPGRAQSPGSATSQPTACRGVRNTPQPTL